MSNRLSGMARAFSGSFFRCSVKKQLGLAFSALLALTLLMGAASLFALNRLDRSAGELSGKWMVGAALVAETRGALIEQREFEVKHSRTSDKSYHGEYEEKITLLAKQVDQQMAAHHAKMPAADELALHAAWVDGWAAYQKASLQVLALGRAGKQQDAADISDGSASMAYDESLNVLIKMTQHGTAGGAAAALQANQLTQQARSAGLLLMALSLALGVLMAVLISRCLLNQLGGEPAVAAAVVQAVSQGDLTTPIPLRAGDRSSLMAHLHAMQESLLRTVTDVRQGSQGVAMASGEIADGNQDLSDRTEQQASSLQQTAATMDELGSTVRNNADHARQANTLAQGASRLAQKGGEVVDQVVHTMKGINDSSRRIADIISVIDGIAFQTNILALNAAVEAARAGEQGRGFAVVASEVRSLAQRSAAAAKEIKGLIGASVERVEQGGAQADLAGQTMQEIVSAIGRVSSIVAEISSASVQQSAGVSQVCEAVTNMDQTTQRNAALVQQSASAAVKLRQQAQQLVEAVAVFRVS